MRAHVLLRLAVGLFLFAATSLAQDQAADMSAQSAIIHRPGAGQGLTGPSQAAPGQVVADFLRANGRSNQTAGSLVAVSEAPAGSSARHVRLEQQVGGLTIHGAYAKATFNADGELVHLIEMLAPVGPVGGASINEADALNAVVGQLYPSARPGLRRGGQNGNTVSFAQNGFFHQDPTVTRVIVPFSNGRLQQGFLVETWTQDANLLHHTLVSGNGQIVSSELRTNQDSYNIFPNYPGATVGGAQTIVAGPGGWLGAGAQTTVNITGNNAHAYLDSDANNSPDSGGSAVTNGNFLAVANLNQSPTTAENKAVAVQNLFYFNNKIHDKLYVHGFNELAGNFQEDNFGNGGFGSDSVNAEAQDGGGTNNANFATPSDGSNPRMQMYLWTLNNPNRDGDVDSDIIYHEYGHGLTWRMIGSMDGPMAGAIGEGMSDVVAILMNGDDKVGEYSYNDPIHGIRSRFYTGYETYRTYGDFTGSSVHYDGEIYAAAIWKLYGAYTTAGFSQSQLFDDLVGGMNFTPSRPAMENMRDGILAAAPADRDCLVWQAFAAFGIGEGASSSVKGGGPFGGGKVTVRESFSVPSSCSGSPEPIQITTTSIPNATEGVAYSRQIATSGGSGTKSWSLTSQPTWLSISQTGVLTASSPQAGTFPFTVEVSDTTGSDTQALTLTVETVAPGSAPAAPTNLTLSAKKPFVMVSWTDASNNESGFYVNRCVGSVGCSLQHIATVPSGTTSYKDTSAVAGTTYTYSVESFNADGTNSTPPQSITK